MQGIELDDVNHIPLAMNEFSGLEQRETKKLRDTKVGQWLKSSAPHLLDAVGDALPDSGVLGIVKNRVDLDIAFEVRDAWVTRHEILISPRWVDTSRCDRCSTNETTACELLNYKPSLNAHQFILAPFINRFKIAP